MQANADTFTESIASAVRAELERKGKKRSDLIPVLRKTRPTISSRLNGHTPFTADELDKVATFLGITAFDLIDSAALGRRFAEGTPVDEASRVSPPQQDAWAQPSRAKARRA